MDSIQIETDTPQDDETFYPLLRWLLFFFFALIVLKNAWLNDDAFITLRTVRNFVDGHGLVWNIDDRVQAYTHPLWMFLLSLTYLLTSETYYSTIFLSLFLSLITAWLVAFRVATTFAGAVIALLLLTLSKAFVDYTTSGLENPLSYLLLTLFFLIYVERFSFSHSEIEPDVAAENPPYHSFLWLVFVASLLLINRLDLGVFILPALLWAGYRLSRESAFGGQASARRRLAWFKALSRTLALTFLGLLPFFLWELFSIFYYGFPFPNTAYAKLGTFIPRTDLFLQGGFYFLNSLNFDPITLTMIGFTICSMIVTKNRTLIPLAIGLFLYLLYVVSIGGGFMSGRWLSVPYLLAVLLFSQLQFPPITTVRTPFLIGILLLVGILNPQRSPLFSDRDYADHTMDHAGITDERGHYYEQYGLLRSSRHTRAVAQGYLQGTADPADFTHCGIGKRGFIASRYTRIVDECGLADAFIARLPPRYDPDWRVGHPLRTVPAGYMETVSTGRNQLHDPKLATYYDRLSIITQGPLFRKQRLIEIWNFNRGAYDHLIDVEQLRFPNILEIALPAPQTPLPNSTKQNSIKLAGQHEEVPALEIKEQGIRINLGQIYRPSHIALEFDKSHFEIVYFHAGHPIASDVVFAKPLQLGRQNMIVIAPPSEAIAAGFDSLRISSKWNGVWSFEGIHLLDLSRLHTDVKDAETLRLLLHFYYHLYYRAEGEYRQTLLPSVRAAIIAAPVDLWQGIDDDMKEGLNKTRDF